jgi:hypothetical protein
MDRPPVLTLDLLGAEPPNFVMARGGNPLQSFAAEVRGRVGGRVAAEERGGVSRPSTSSWSDTKLLEVSRPHDAPKAPPLLDTLAAPRYSTIGSRCARYSTIGARCARPAVLAVLATRPRAQDTRRRDHGGCAESFVRIAHRRSPWFNQPGGSECDETSERGKGRRRSWI